MTIRQQLNLIAEIIGGHAPSREDDFSPIVWLDYEASPGVTLGNAVYVELGDSSFSSPDDEIDNLSVFLDGAVMHQSLAGVEIDYSRYWQHGLAIDAILADDIDLARSIMALKTLTEGQVNRAANHFLNGRVPAAREELGL